MPRVQGAAHARRPARHRQVSGQLVDTEGASLVTALLSTLKWRQSGMAAPQLQPVACAALCIISS